MPSVNNVVIAGNLTRDPEMRYTTTGKPVASLGIAVNSHWTSESGEKKERVEFIDVTVWGRSAENCAKYLRKGAPALVTGHLQRETWEQDGENRSKIIVVADSVQFLGAPKEPAKQPATTTGSSRQPATRGTR